MSIISRMAFDVSHALTVRSLPAPQPVTWETVFGSRGWSPTGITVSEHSALNHSPVWCGVTTLAGDIAKLPFGLYRNTKDGGKEPFKEHRLYRILHDEANPEMSSYKFRETMQALCILYGNAYAEIVRNAVGEVYGLYPIVPTRVTPLRENGTLPNGFPNPRSGQLVYRVSQPSGGNTYVLPENMIHLSSLSTDGIIGHSIVEHGRESIELGLAAEKFGASFFGNGATFGGTVEVPMTLNGPEGQKVKDGIREAIEAIHAGVERAHKILVLAGGSKFTQRGTAPDNAQFIETRKFQVNEVSRWLGGMPPHKLGDYENAHLANIEHSEIGYWKGPVHRWLKMWEQECSRKLIKRLEYAQQSIAFNMDGELRGDSASRADFYTKLFNVGAFSPNDILRLEDKNPVPGGDIRLVPLNMVPLEKYEEMIQAQIDVQKSKITAAASEPPQITDGTVVEESERFTALETEIRALAARAQEHEQRSMEFLTQFKSDSERQAEILAAASRSERDKADELRALAAEKQVALDAMTAERDSAARAAQEEGAARTEAERRAQEAETRMTEAQLERDAKLAELQQASDAVAAAVARAVAAEQRGETSEQEKAEAQRQIDEARAVLLEREAAVKQAQTAAEEARSEAAKGSETISALEAEQERRQKADDARVGRFLVAYKSLVADAVQRIALYEVERMRKRSQSPDQLKRWAEAFYDEARVDECAERFFPYTNALATLKGDEADARSLAQAMAVEYCNESKRSIETLTAGMDGAEFQAEVVRMLTRWERERPQAVADKVVGDEIATLVSR